MRADRRSGTTAALVVLALVASDCAPSAPDPSGVTNDTILIGMEGQANSFSVDEENRGMHLAIRDVNDRGGIHGRRLEPRSYPRSGGAAADEAVANARRLLEEDRVFLLFNFGGPQSVRVAQLAMERKVPHLFPHTALITEDGQRYVFTSYPRYRGESEAMWRHLTGTRGFTRFAIVYADNVYGTFFRDRLAEYAERDGHQMTGSLAVSDRVPGDLSAELAMVRASRPEAVILALYPEQAQAVMRATAALGWADVTMVSSGPLTDEQYLDVDGGPAEGTIGFCHYPDPLSSDEPGVETYRALMARYYPDRPLNRYSLYGYVFGRLIVEGLERTGRELTRERFVDAMESIQGWDSGGILPAVSFSASNHHAQRAGYLCELRDGRFEAVTGWIEP
jgi:ABC-type branched-subunit amino acid transport system substrate-binding protein